MTTSCQQTSREWNAADYHRLSTPQFRWGQRVLNDLRLRGDECVLDAGCGTGKLTHLLLQNLPGGRVVGLDLSRNMVEHARRDLQAAFGERAQFVAADLLALPFRDAFDGIFSTASTPGGTFALPACSLSQVASRSGNVVSKSISSSAKRACS